MPGQGLSPIDPGLPDGCQALGCQGCSRLTRFIPGHAATAGRVTVLSPLLGLLLLLGVSHERGQLGGRGRGCRQAVGAPYKSPDRREVGVDHRAPAVKGCGCPAVGQMAAPAIRFTFQGLHARQGQDRLGSFGQRVNGGSVRACHWFKGGGWAGSRQVCPSLPQGCPQARSTRPVCRVA
jgi:hypothetical protein